MVLTAMVVISLAYLKKLEKLSYPNFLLILDGDFSTFKTNVLDLQRVIRN